MPKAGIEPARGCPHRILSAKIANLQTLDIRSDFLKHIEIINSFRFYMIQPVPSISVFSDPFYHNFITQK
jgi:hypothetical protein